MPNPNVGWFFINLDRSPDRCREITADLNAFGIHAIRVPGVEGRRLTLPMPGVDADRYRRTHGKSLRMAEVGCFLSHLRVMRTFLASTYDYAMVLEDDALATGETVRLVDMLSAPGARDDWDMVKFEAHHHNSGFRLRRLFGRYRLCALPTRPTGSAAYLANRRTATAYIERLMPMVVPLDHAFDRGWALGLRIRSIIPSPVTVRPTPSTITTGAHAGVTKVRLREKGPVLLWRTKTEVMRFVSACHAWLVPTRPFPFTPKPRPEAEELADAAEKAVVTAEARGGSG